MRDQINAAMATLIPQFSEQAQRRRDEITSELRVVCREAFQVRVSELRRLVAEGREYQDALTAACVVLQKLETEDLRDPLGIVAMGFVLDAAHSDAKKFFSSDAQSEIARVEDRAFALALEDLELSERELSRIGLETGGKQGRDYAAAACLVRAIREQIATPGIDILNPGGPLGLIMEAVQSSARDELQSGAQSN